MEREKSEDDLDDMEEDEVFSESEDILQNMSLKDTKEQSTFNQRKLPSNIQKFVDMLQKKVFFNIKTKKIEQIFGTPNSPPPGQPAVPSDQTVNNEQTCVSHSMGKLIVEIADMFGLDTDQEQIIQHMIRAFQPDKRGRHLHELNYDTYSNSTTIIVWESGNPNEKYAVNLGLHVQVELIDNKWKGVKIEPGDLKNGIEIDCSQKLPVKMVAIEEVVPKPKIQRHAMYVKSFTKEKLSSKTNFQFTCIDSDGVNEDPKELQTKDKDKIFCLYYISLFYKEIYTISTSGDSAECTSRMGIFAQAGDCYEYEQLHTVPGTEGRLFVRDEDGVWTMKKSMLDEASPLRSKSVSGDIPDCMWNYKKDGKWIPDNKMIVAPGPPLLCQYIIISAPGAEAFPEEVLGTYLPTSEFSSGRQIFKNETQELYLHVISGRVPWFISPVINSEKDAVMMSGTAPSLCPGDMRARYRQKIKRNSWVYMNAENEWIEVPEQFVVICNSCNR